MALRAWLVCAIVVQTVVAGNPDAKRLYDDLLSNYNKLVRPVVNVTDVLRVCIKLKLSQLIDVIECDKENMPPQRNFNKKRSSLSEDTVDMDLENRSLVNKSEPPVEDDFSMSGRRVVDIMFQIDQSIYYVGSCFRKAASWK